MYVCGSKPCRVRVDREQTRQVPTHKTLLFGLVQWRVGWVPCGVDCFCGGPGSGDGTLSKAADGDQIRAERRQILVVNAESDSLKW